MAGMHIIIATTAWPHDTTTLLKVALSLLNTAYRSIKAATDHAAKYVASCWTTAAEVICPSLAPGVVCSQVDRA